MKLLLNFLKKAESETIIEEALQQLEFSEEIKVIANEQPVRRSIRFKITRVKQSVILPFAGKTTLNP